MALYTKQQLQIERSKGLVLSDYDNEHFYDPNPNLQEWSDERFEEWLATKKWAEEVKDYHRSLFNGFISFDGNGGFSYE